jgi:hypothetical protein
VDWQSQGRLQALGLFQFEVGGDNEGVKEKQQEQDCSLQAGKCCRGTEERKTHAMPPFTQRQNSNPLLMPRDVIESQSYGKQTEVF